VAPWTTTRSAPWKDLDLIAAQLIGARERAAEFGVELWTESLHFLRFCWNLERAGLLADRLAGSGVGIVMDFSHIVAAGEEPLDLPGPAPLPGHARPPARCRAREHQPQHRQRQADFAAGLKRLAAQGYTGHFSLELETRDVTHEERPAAAAKAASFITDLI
jgi:sugar phosphate isomerase/epimerase